MNSFKFSDDPGVPEALNRAAREQMKLRLMRDIRTDIEVCRLEGWEYRKYLQELRDLIDSFFVRSKGENQMEFSQCLVKV